MTIVRPTVKDVARAVARLDEHADTPEQGAVKIDGIDWTREELRRSVADSMSFMIGQYVRLGQVSKRDAAILLAANGANPFTIEQHARAIAAMLRGNRYRDGNMSAFI